MSQDMMKIPKKIKVGYQERKDTYTGKLAYVVYFDEKGVLRKEASWNSWRNKEIEPSEFDNVPTSGFVMNKKVGDYKSDWNHRKAHIRMYDPRGFEFEIGVENLLYILEECNSIKGKGLEGEFVYAFDKADLVLLPVTAQEYASSSKFTNMQTNKVSKKDVIEGCVYINKQMKEVMYLGHHEVFDYDRGYNNGGGSIVSSHKSEGKKHVFQYINPEKPSYGEAEKYWFQTGFTKLASKVSDVISPTFPEEYEKFMKSTIACQCDKVVVSTYRLKSSQLPPDTCYYACRNVIMNLNGKLTRVTIDREREKRICFEIRNVYNTTVEVVGSTVVENSYHRSGGYWGYNNDSTLIKKLTEDELLEIDFTKIELVNAHGDSIIYSQYGY
jgi:hypothetical protein